MGSVLYNSSSWGWGLSISQCFLLQAILPVATLFPTIPYMLEVICTVILNLDTDCTQTPDRFFTVANLGRSDTQARTHPPTHKHTHIHTRARARACTHARLLTHPTPFREGR